MITSEADRHSRFQRAINRGPILLDAGLGSRLIAQGLDPTCDDPSLWALDRPEAVAGLHRLDVQAGADAVTTNTFGANRTWLARFGRSEQVGAINRQAVILARSVAGPDRFVIGSIGPMADWKTIGPDGRNAEQDQAAWLSEAGADLLLLETNVESEPIAGRIRALRMVSRLPILVSFSVVITKSPPQIDDDLKALGVVGLGWNCQPSATICQWLEQRTAGWPDLPRFVLPGRLPNSGPEAAPIIDEPTVGWLRDQGVRLFGGCCGSTDRDLANVRQVLGPSSLG